MFEENAIPKRTIKVKWQNDFETEFCFTYYASKNELRITRFGRGFPFLRINQTDSLFVFTKQAEEDYSGYLEVDFPKSRLLQDIYRTKLMITLNIILTESYRYTIIHMNNSTYVKN